jgi:hypothetical protein
MSITRNYDTETLYATEPPPSTCLYSESSLFPLLDRFEEALGTYWNCAYQEGRLHISDGDQANAILHEIRGAVDAIVQHKLSAQLTGHRAATKLGDQ